MNRSLSLLALFPLVFVSTFAYSEVDDDPLIRQVVGAADGDLSADHRHFSLFKRRFGKSYSSQEEHDHRFKVFRANLRRARRHQQLDPSAIHGVTQFSDLTPSEFRRSYLGVRSGLRLPNDANQAPLLPTDDLPEDFDWRDHGAVTAVKNQANASACSESSTGTFSTNPSPQAPCSSRRMPAIAIVVSPTRKDASTFNFSIPGGGGLQCTVLMLKNSCIPGFPNLPQEMSYNSDRNLVRWRLQKQGHKRSICSTVSGP